MSKSTLACVRWAGLGLACSAMSGLWVSDLSRPAMEHGLLVGLALVGGGAAAAAFGVDRGRYANWR